MTATTRPTVFISYAWDTDVTPWVKELATRLRTDGIEVILDRWLTIPGDQLPAFMETAVRESDFVLPICTPKYKAKSDNRQGGVGYEGYIMTGEVSVFRNHNKFIPILYKGEWEKASPSWLLGTYYIDLSEQPLHKNLWIRGVYCQIIISIYYRVYHVSSQSRSQTPQRSTIL